MSICFFYGRVVVTSHKKSVFSFTSFKLKKLECAKGNKNDRIQKKYLKQFLQNLMPINIKVKLFSLYNFKVLLQYLLFTC